MIFDIESLGQDYGEYQPQSDTITIYLATMYHDFKKDNNLTPEILYNQIVDVLYHEWINKAIDECLIVEKPQEIDDHSIYKYLGPFLILWT